MKTKNIFTKLVYIILILVGSFKNNYSQDVGDLVYNCHFKKSTETGSLFHYLKHNELVQRMPDTIWLLDQNNETIYCYTFQSDSINNLLMMQNHYFSDKNCKLWERKIIYYDTNNNIIKELLFNYEDTMKSILPTYQLDYLYNKETLKRIDKCQYENDKEELIRTNFLRNRTISYRFNNNQFVKFQIIKRKKSLFWEKEIALLKPKYFLPKMKVVNVYNKRNQLIIRKQKYIILGFSLRMLKRKNSYDDNGNILHRQCKNFKSFTHYNRFRRAGINKRFMKNVYVKKQIKDEEHFLNKYDSAQNLIEVIHQRKSDSGYINFDKKNYYYDYNNNPIFIIESQSVNCKWQETRRFFYEYNQLNNSISGRQEYFTNGLWQPSKVEELQIFFNGLVFRIPSCYQYRIKF